MRTAYIRVLLLGLLLLPSGCTQGRREKGTDRDTRLQYTPEVNEVEVCVLQEGPFHREIVSNGKLSAVLRSAIHFRANGTIEELSIRNGQRVARGTVLARLDSREKEINLKAATLALSKAEIDLYADLAGLGYTARDTTSVPKDILASAKMRSGYSNALIACEKARLDLDGVSLRAPFSGKIADLAYKRYDAIGSEAFCTLIDDSSYEVVFPVFETEFRHIPVGTVVKILPYGQSDQVRTGRVSSVNPTIDKNGQVLIKARVAGDPGLLDGMNVKVIAEETVPGQLVVPKSAVVIRDNLEVLFRYRSGQAEWVYVRTLSSNSREYAIVANADRGAHLAPGDSIIISGNLNLADNSQVSLKR